MNYLQKLESEFQMIKKSALHFTRGVSPYDKELFIPIKDSFDLLEQNSIEDLDELTIDLRAKLNALHIDPNAPQVFNDCENLKKIFFLT